MHECPKCRSHQIHRSRARSKWETWRKEITGRRPFRCSACGWRGWSVESGPRFSDDEIERADRALAADPPDLKSTNLPGNERRRPDVDVGALDTLEPFDKKRE